ncbi:MAG: hypothetical protein GX790_02760 [Syntrophomonadaceae bacterium]|nr:hypothetical protein [Syntrophomonadaceae bacterium]
MFIKRILIIFIIVVVGVNLLVNYQYKFVGVDIVLDYYADMVSAKSPVKILYNPGLRGLDSSNSPLNIQAVLPHSKNFSETLNQLLVQQCDVIVECSDLDSWHTSTAGNEYLSKIREQAYRVVIFDGGHHLPTLGLEPDIIILPVLNGYALHSYMLDGIKTDMIIEIVKNINAPIVVAQVSRWSLVKNQKSMTTITLKAIEQAKKETRINTEFVPISNTKMSKYNQAVLAYVDKKYSKDMDLFLSNLKKLGLDEVKIIYLAFDYKWISLEESRAYAKEVSNLTKIRVEVVNESVKVSNSFWGGS